MTEAVVFCEKCGKGINLLAGETVYVCNSCKKKICDGCSEKCVICDKYVCHDDISFDGNWCYFRYYNRGILISLDELPESFGDELRRMKMGVIGTTIDILIEQRIPPETMLETIRLMSERCDKAMEKAKELICKYLQIPNQTFSKDVYFEWGVVCNICGKKAEIIHLPKNFKEEAGVKPNNEEKKKKSWWGR